MRRQANGLEIDTSDCLIDGLIISNFAFSGIVINQMATPGIPGNNLILGNFIGTNATGSAPAPNGASGIVVVDSTSNDIGGNSPGEGNLISGNSGSGIQIADAASTGNVVEGNYIGTNVNGTIAISNAFDGISFGELTNPVVGVGYASNNTVGGTAAGARNIISGNGRNGVHIDGGSGNVVLGNYIGTDVNGTGARAQRARRRAGRRRRHEHDRRHGDWRGQRHFGQCRERRGDRLDRSHRGRLFHHAGEPVVEFQRHPGERDRDRRHRQLHRSGRQGHSRL